MTTKIKCPHCKSTDLRIGVNIFLYTDIKYLSHLTKKAIRDKETELWGADWDTSSWICKKCGYLVRNGIAVAKQLGRRLHNYSEAIGGGKEGHCWRFCGDDDEYFKIIEGCKETITDAQIIDWLEKQNNKMEYTGRCIFRWSSTGRGWRLHETEGVGAYNTVREAIVSAMRKDKIGGDNGDNEIVEN